MAVSPEDLEKQMFGKIENAAQPFPKRSTCSSQDKAFAVLLTNESYLPGVLTLDHSLRSTSPSYPLLVLYTPNTLPSIPDSPIHLALNARRIPKRAVLPLAPPFDKDYGNDPRFADTWTKLCVFGLYDFDRIVLLDADMVVKRNIDELMDPGSLQLGEPSSGGASDATRQGKVFAAAHACVCNPNKKPHYPKDWVPANCAFTHQHSQPNIAQTQAPPPHLSHYMPNSGLLALRPSRPAYRAILAQLQDRDAVASYTFPDQALLRDVFRHDWTPLPYVYNALKTLRRPDVHGEIWRDENVKVVHYIFGPKPWDGGPEQGKADEVLWDWWWDADRERRHRERAKGVEDEYSDGTTGWRET